MTTIIHGNDLRRILFGTRVEKSTGTLAASTVPLFTVAGGLVAVTSIVGKVTTAITVANSYKLQHNPTTGTTGDIFAATDIGTTDTPAGSLIGFSTAQDDQTTATVVALPGRAHTLNAPLILSEGVIESVSAGTDGVILWVLTYVPLDNNASIVAA
jgi:hypothetical protein